MRYLFYKIATQTATNKSLDLKYTRVRSRSRVMLVLLDSTSLLDLVVDSTRLK